jgi:hypothetical protein
MNSKRSILLTFVFAAAIFLAGCGEKKMEQQEKDQSKVEKKENIVRTEEVIDVESIDLNKDGMLYECPMDWNVIDDKSNACPTCGMNLEEFTVVNVKENLVKNGYKVK